MQIKPEPASPKPAVPKHLAHAARVLSLLLGLIQPAQAAETSATPVPPPFQELMAKPEILGRLRAGGYVLYMRHGTTDNKIGRASCRERVSSPV